MKVASPRPATLQPSQHFASRKNKDTSCILLPSFFQSTLLPIILEFALDESVFKKILLLDEFEREIMYNWPLKIQKYRVRVIISFIFSYFSISREFVWNVIRRDRETIRRRWSGRVRCPLPFDISCSTERDVSPWKIDLGSNLFSNLLPLVELSFLKSTFLSKSRISRLPVPRKFTFPRGNKFSLDFPPAFVETYYRLGIRSESKKAKKNWKF